MELALGMMKENSSIQTLPEKDSPHLFTLVRLCKLCIFSDTRCVSLYSKSPQRTYINKSYPTFGGAGDGDLAVRHFLHDGISRLSEGRGLCVKDKGYSIRTAQGIRQRVYLASWVIKATVNNMCQG
jgi:hypothetical protein